MGFLDGFDGFEGFDGFAPSLELPPSLQQLQQQAAAGRQRAPAQPAGPSRQQQRDADAAAALQDVDACLQQVRPRGLDEQPAQISLAEAAWALARGPTLLSVLRLCCALLPRSQSARLQHQHQASQRLGMRATGSSFCW